MFLALRRLESSHMGVHAYLPDGKASLLLRGYYSTRFNPLQYLLQRRNMDEMEGRRSLKRCCRIQGYVGYEIVAGCNANHAFSKIIQFISDSDLQAFLKGA